MGRIVSCLQRPCREENKSHSSYSYCRNTNNRDELSDKPTNAPPTKRGTRRGTKRGKKGVVNRSGRLAALCTRRSLRRRSYVPAQVASSPCEMRETKRWKLTCVRNVAIQVDHRRPTAIHEVAWISFPSGRRTMGTRDNCPSGTVKTERP